MKRLYEDNVFGRISDERFASMSADYEAEARKLKERLEMLDELLASYTKQNRDAKAFASLVAQYTDITCLTEELVHTLIEKVVVHKKEVIGGETMMRKIFTIASSERLAMKTERHSKHKKRAGTPKHWLPARNPKWGAQ